MIDLHLDNLKIFVFKTFIRDVEDTLLKIDDIKEEGEIIQFLNADSIVSFNQIIHGVNQAFLAFDRNENYAKDISVEIVLRCSAQNQISRAFDILGLKEGEMNICILLINSGDSILNRLSSLFNLEEINLSPDYSRLRDIYNIGDVEIENMSVEDIVIDKITKLTVDF